MKQPAERTASLVRQARLISQQLSKFFPYDPIEFKTYIFQSQKSWLPDRHPYAKTIMRHYIAMNRFRIVKGQESEFNQRPVFVLSAVGVRRFFCFHVDTDVAKNCGNRLVAHSSSEEIHPNDQRDRKVFYY